MRRLEWMLTGLIVLLVIAVGALLWLVGSEQRRQANFDNSVQQQVATSSQETPALATPEPDDFTAKQAYALAEPVARQWASDAVLLSAQATWPQDSNPEADSAAWGLIFYSPRRSATALINVTEEMPALLSTRSTEKRFNVAPLERWQVDSPQIIERFLAGGGRDFWNDRERVTLILELNADERLRWQARLVDTEAKRAFTLQLDPESGDIVPQPSTQ